MSGVVVFLGPTLARHEASAICPATYLPPASAGDVYAAARRRPAAIAVVDGYFARMPSVWHKEVLWAMARGVHVYGASSMGALRAAELEAFGMVGVGEVFAAYRDGVLEDDDEVALAHAPAELGYAAASEAMVNMRATYAAALAEGVVGRATHDAMVAAAKRAHFTERGYAAPLARAEADGLPADECRAFRAWLATGRRDVKRSDAIALLERLAAAHAGDTAPKRVTYTFHVTYMWEALRHAVDGRPQGVASGAETGPDGAVLDELRLEGDAYERARERALLRLLAVELGYLQGARPADGAPRRAMEAVREERGLASVDALVSWLAAQGLTPDGVRRLMEDEAQARAVTARYRSLLPAYLGDHLRLSGRFAALDRRARAKQYLLWRHGADNPGLDHAGIGEDELWGWFFGTLLGRPVPDDLEAAAAAMDFGGVEPMRRTALREYVYRMLAGRATAADAHLSAAPHGVP